MKGLRRKISGLVVIGLLALPAASQAASLDPSFGGGDGRVFTEIQRTPHAGYKLKPIASNVAEDADGRLLTAGSNGREFVVSRYLPDGELDPSFGDPDGLGPEQGTGTVSVGNWQPQYSERRQGAYANTLTVQQDGKVLVGGVVQVYDRDPFVNVGHSTWAMARFNPDGSLDSSFDEDGRWYRRVGFGRDLVSLWDLVVQKDGKIVFGGFQGKQPLRGYTRATVVRLNPDGSTDKSFGPSQQGGISFIAGVRKNAGIHALKVLPSGKILGVGHFDFDFLSFRLNANGTLDRSYGNRGKTVTNPARRDCHCSIAMGFDTDRRGRLVLVGYTQNPDYLVMSRYTRNGQLDRRFGRRGVVRTRINDFRTRGFNVVIQRNGRIVVAGRWGLGEERSFALLRYMPDGSRDKSFFGDGLFSAHLGGGGSANEVIIDRANRLVAVGYNHKPGAVLMRLLP